MSQVVRAVLVTALLVGAAGCGVNGGEASSRRAVQPRDGQAGLLLTGTAAGRQLAVSDGGPALHVGDCEARLGIPARVCFASRGIDGAQVILALANPDALTVGEPVAIVRSDCRSAARCAEVRDGAVVDLQIGERRVRARAGTVTLTELVEGARYVGTITLTLPDGRVSGHFDVIPRPE